MQSMDLLIIVPGLTSISFLLFDHRHTEAVFHCIIMNIYNKKELLAKTKMFLAYCRCLSFRCCKSTVKLCKLDMVCQKKYYC